MSDEERMIAEALLEAQQRTTLYPNAKAIADNLAPLVLEGIREARGFADLHRTVIEFCATLRLSRGSDHATTEGGRDE